MCVVSMVGDHYNQKWNEPFYRDLIDRIQIKGTNPITTYMNWDLVTREEFDSLKKEVEEMKELLKRAVEYDERNNEPHCEIEEKVEVLKKVAELLEVNLDDIFRK